MKKIRSYYHLDKQKIKLLALEKFGSVDGLIKALEVSRSRYHFCLNKNWVAMNSPFIYKLLRIFYYEVEDIRDFFLVETRRV